MTTSSPAKTSITRKTLWSKSISLVLFALLIILFIYWNYTREGGFNIGIFLFQTLPLLALLPGLLKPAYRSYSWLCFLLLFYFIFSVQLVFGSIRQISDFIFLGLIVLLFISSMMTSRWMQRLHKGV